jgi:hypothetical protein
VSEAILISRIRSTLTSLQPSQSSLSTAKSRRSASLSCESNTSILGLINQPSRTDSKPCTCSTCTSQPRCMILHTIAASGTRCVLDPFIHCANCITSCRKFYSCRAAVIMQESGWGNGMALQGRICEEWQAR